MQLLELRSGGTSSKLTAHLDDLAPRSMPVYLPGSPGADGMRVTGVQEWVWGTIIHRLAPAERGEGVFLVAGDKPRLTPKLRMRWRTLAQR
jgi:hypothetical protein